MAIFETRQPFRDSEGIALHEDEVTNFEKESCLNL